jgi:hypothetical protein
MISDLANETDSSRSFSNEANTLVDLKEESSKTKTGEHFEICLPQLFIFSEVMFLSFVLFTE